MDLQENLFWKHRDDLLRIMTVLWNMAGLAGGTTIRQSVYVAVTRLLRPAEAATRRLIVVLAQKITVTLKPSRTRLSTASPARPDGERSGKPDPSGNQPQWKDFSLAEPLPRWPRPGDEPRGFPAILRGSDREIDGQRLALRFDALCHALDDLHGQARRLARWAALRRRARQRGKFRTVQPLRTGLPVDLRGAARRRLSGHELFHILAETHQRACWAAPRPKDTG